VTVLRAEGPVPKPETTRAAAVKALSLIEKSMAEYRRQRTCFSCHHHTLPLLALTEAKRRGIHIDEENYRKQLRSTADHLRRGRSNYLLGRGQGGGVDTAGNGLWALEAGGWKPDDTTAAVVEYLLQVARPEGFWRGTRGRPPTQASDITRTAVILRGLDTFGTKEQQERIAERKKKARAWLSEVRPRDTEDKVSLLRALAYLGEDEKTIKEAAIDLLKDQRTDGGWAQRPDRKSDAYATGTALVALHEAAGVRADDPAYQRGIEYLLKTQQEDGSWHVRTHSNPVQVYFESGFPHGKDQFISIGASSWAATALLLATPAEGGKE
jgi:squalene cyclase